MLPQLNVTQNLKHRTVDCISNTIHFSKLIFTLHLETHLLVDQHRSEVHIKTSLHCMNLLRDEKTQGRGGVGWRDCLVVKTIDYSFQRTEVQFSVSPWWLTIVCNVVHRHISKKNTYTHTFFLKEAGRTFGNRTLTDHWWSHPHYFINFF